MPRTERILIICIVGKEITSSYWYFSVTTRAAIGHFTGAFSTVRPTKIPGDVQYRQVFVTVMANKRVRRLHF